MKKIKLLYVITGLNVGGAETMLCALLSKINRDRFDPYVISMQDEGVFGEKIKTLNIPLFCLRMKVGIPSIRIFLQYRRVTKQIKPHIIHGWMYHANLMMILSKVFGYKGPLIFSIHSTLVNEFENFKLFTKWVIKGNICGSYFANKVTFCSKVSQQQHEKIGFKKTNTIYLPNGFDTDIFAPSEEQYQLVRQELNVDMNTKFVGMFAAFHPRKNHSGFLKIAELIKKHYSGKVKFLLAGTNIEATNVVLAKMIGDTYVKDDIFILGSVITKNYMPAIDVLLLPSIWGEAFPMVIGEAMACGVPCVATDVGDIKVLINNLGSVGPVNDNQMLAEEVIRWLDAGVQMKKQIRQHIIESYPIQKIVNDYEKLYLDILSGECLKNNE